MSQFMYYLRKIILPGTEYETGFPRWGRHEQHVAGEFRRRTMRDTDLSGGKARGLPSDVSRPIGFYDTESIE